jgi:hypothetical protein
MSIGPFIPPVGVPQDISGLAIGNLLARTRAMEGFRIPAKFEIVSDIFLPVPAGVCADMMIARDMNQMRLIDAFAWVFTVASADIEVMIVSDTDGDLLVTPLVITAGLNSTLGDLDPLPDIVPGVPLPQGTLISIDVLDPGADGYGLGVGLIYG